MKSRSKYIQQEYNTNSYDTILLHQPMFSFCQVLGSSHTNSCKQMVLTNYNMHLAVISKRYLIYTLSQSVTTTTET